MAKDMFFATLKGVEYKDVYTQILNLDRTIYSYEERLKEVEKIVYKNPYLQEFFDKYYDPHLTKTNTLSENHNISSMVEMLTNYLLMSDEAKQIEDKDKTFYLDADKLTKNKESPQDILESSQKNNFMVVKFNKSNITKQKKVVVTAKDLREESKAGSVLRDLQEGVEDTTYKLKNGLGNRVKLSKLKHQLMEDQIQTKISLKGIFGLNTNPSFFIDDTNYYSTLSENNAVKSLLSMSKDKEISEEWLDLERLLLEVPFSKRDKQILSMYNKGYPVIEIADILDVSHQFISIKITKLSKRISKYNHLKQVNCLKDKIEKV